MTPDFKAAREAFERPSVKIMDGVLWLHVPHGYDKFTDHTLPTIRTALALVEKVMEPSEGMVDHARTAVVAANSYVVGKFEIPEAKERVLIHAAFKAMIEQACKEVKDGQSL